jgi:hypothetical protein
MNISEPSAFHARGARSNIHCLKETLLTVSKAAMVPAVMQDQHSF